MALFDRKEPKYKSSVNQVLHRGFEMGGLDHKENEVEVWRREITIFYGVEKLQGHRKGMVIGLKRIMVIRLTNSNLSIREIQFNMPNFSMLVQSTVMIDQAGHN